MIAALWPVFVYFAVAAPATANCLVEDFREARRQERQARVERPIGLAPMRVVSMAGGDRGRSGLEAGSSTRRDMPASVRDRRRA